MKNLLAFLFVFVACISGFAADLSITAASFVPSTSAKYLTGIAGTTITAGQVVVTSASTGKYVLADADDSTIIGIVGVAAHGASAGQPLNVVTEDPDLTLGATLSMSVPIYVLSSTAGGIAPSADISVGEYPLLILVAKSTTKCVLKPRVLHGTAAAVAP